MLRNSSNHEEFRIVFPYQFLHGRSPNAIGTVSGRSRPNIRPDSRRRDFRARFFVKSDSKVGWPVHAWGASMNWPCAMARAKRYFARRSAFSRKTLRSECNWVEAEV